MNGSVYAAAIKLGTTNSNLTINNGTVSGVITGPVQGGGIVQTGGNVTFKSNIGSSTNSLTHLNLGAAGDYGANRTITMDGLSAPVYSSNITHLNTTIDTTAQNLTFHGGTGAYIMNNATWNAGTKTVTIDATTATLTGPITINATYAITGQVVLDLSGSTTIVDSGITALTFNITSSTPTANDTIVMVKGLSNSIVPTVGMNTDPYWKVSSTPGTFIYTPPVSSSPPITSANITVPAGVSVVGASPRDIEQAVIKLGSAAQINERGVVTLKIIELNPLRTDNTRPLSQSRSSQQILSLPSISNLNVLDTNVPVGSGTTKVNSSVAAYAGQFDTPELQEGWVGIFSKTLTENDGLLLDPSITQPFALIASNANLIPPTMANAIVHPEDGGTSTELVDTMVRVAATDGPAIAKEMVDRISAGGNGSSVTALNNIQTRQSTQLLPPQIIISSPPPMGVIVKAVELS